jgi:hypothetical protein
MDLLLVLMGVVAVIATLAMVVFWPDVKAWRTASRFTPVRL